MLERIWRAATAANGFDAVVILTDHDRVARACSQWGADCRMTPEHFASGTDRVAYAVSQWFGDTDIVLNLQADEPLVQPWLLESLLQALATHPWADVATPIAPIHAATDVLNPTVCKVVCRTDGTALLFSRAPIPYDRRHQVGALEHYHKHIGIYAYRRQALELFASLPPDPIEQLESLEQLRLLRAGAQFICVPTDAELIAVDTPEDAERVRAYLRGHAML